MIEKSYRHQKNISPGPIGRLHSKGKALQLDLEKWVGVKMFRLGRRANAAEESPYIKEETEVTQFG